MIKSGLSKIEAEILSCLSLDTPVSFFLFAGAGSGKTRSLVEVLKEFQKLSYDRLMDRGRQVGIITYTNAASDEIKSRLEYEPIFVVSTIHSFSWELIKFFQKDIKDWVRYDTENELKELKEQLRRGRPNTKAALDRKARIESKERRLADLDLIDEFTYDPNGVQTGRESLNHSEVLKIISDFIASKPLMQKIFIQKFPILLIDESQDTNKDLLDAFFTLQKKYESRFALGLFGDTMQRVYMDGKPDLGENIPGNWKKPAKEINYRCPKRVVRLINKIRSQYDGQIQKAASGSDEGLVRLFIVESDDELDKQKIEKDISIQMAKLSGDELWENLDSSVKTLTQKHPPLVFTGHSAKSCCKFPSGWIAPSMARAEFGIIVA